jgi:hypothetical protein
MVRQKTNFSFINDGSIDRVEIVGRKLQAPCMYETNDYNAFRFYQGNRDINPGHVQKLKRSFEKRVLFTVLHANEQLAIIDGQHRFLALKMLNLPFNYIVLDGYALQEIQVYNTQDLKWTTNDYAKSYCDLGYDSYKVAMWFKEKYKLNWPVALQFLSGSAASQTTIKFKNGSFKITNLEFAQKCARITTLFQPYFEGYMLLPFTQAIYWVLRYCHKIDTARLIKRVSKQSEKMTRQATMLHYIQLIDHIYNYKTPIDKRYLIINEIDSAVLAEGNSDKKKSWHVFTARRFM